MKTTFIILIIYCAFSASEEKSIKKEAVNPNQMAFDSVPSHNQDYFITLHLALGLNERAHAAPFDPVDGFQGRQLEALDLPQDINLSTETYNFLRAIMTPDDFSTDLLDWTEDTFALTDDDIHEMVVRSSVCQSDGQQCITPGDIGSVCCPF
ncbi:uncharacterized protein LOC129800551 [Phlebotomus papatasi]|uniref:uncharacterized protein LOC129800551 n=1 Tax=Phlebotomus papatasi TaxID=29031 RepID=UPI00248448EB|nr:uncharacterized protein LOC129800551 [Phlebotomus papatasi]